VPSHVGIHHFKLLYKKIEGNLHLKNLKYYQFDKQANDVGSQYLKFFWELRAWDCINHCRESIGGNIDHYYILMPLHLKYLLN